jgi:chemotaxis protein MotB
LTEEVNIRNRRLAELEAALAAAGAKAPPPQVSDLEAALASLRAELALADSRSSAAQATAQNQLKNQLQEMETLRAALIAEQEQRRKEALAAQERENRLLAALAATRQDLERLQVATEIDETRLRELVETERRINQSLEGLIARKSVDVERSGTRLVLKLSSEILFDTGSADLKGNGLPLLADVGSILKDSLAGMQIQIGGHTDNIAFSGGRRYRNNWELSAARAASVVGFFEKNSGIDPDKLSAVGFGEYRPAADNQTKEGRARNRRIEIILLPR